MRVIVPGHLYRVPYLEHPGFLMLRFLRRSSDMIQHPIEWPGVNTQDIIRCCIERTRYLNNLGPCEESANAITWLELALYEYEVRAWRRKMQHLNKRADAQAETDRIDATRQFYRDVPFLPGDVYGMKVGPDGHVIVEDYK